MLASNANYKAMLTHAEKASLKIATFSDYTKGNDDYTKAFDEADGIVFEQLGIVVINENRNTHVSMLTESSSSKSTFIYSEPERYVYALTDSIDEFMRGYKSAVDDIYHNITSEGKSSMSKSISYHDDSFASWGIHATNVFTSKFTGKGVNIALLDTGPNIKHPDFAGRVIKSKSFIRGQKVEDQYGHGSHCTGIATGNININSNRRYGVAKNANVFIGKVLSNTGIGSDSGILAGLEWSITNNCKIISMSLGAVVFDSKCKTIKFEFFRYWSRSSSSTIEYFENIFVYLRCNLNGYEKFPN